MSFWIVTLRSEVIFKYQLKKIKKLETNQMAVENFYSNYAPCLILELLAGLIPFYSHCQQTFFSKRIISKVLANKSINVDVEPRCKEIAIQSIGDLLWHMATEGKW